LLSSVKIESKIGVRIGAFGAIKPSPDLEIYDQQTKRIRENGVKVF